MATIKVLYENRDKLVSEFNNYFSDNANRPQSKYRSVIIKRSNERSNKESLLQLFDNNQIRYSYAGSTGKKFKGFDYASNKDGEITIEKGDILVSAFQSQSRLVQILFEPDSKTSDSLSYDLTAWALPYAYNLKAVAIPEKIAPDTGKVEYRTITNIPGADNIYAYVVNFNGFNELKLMAALYRKNIKLRYSLKPFTLNGTGFNRGSIYKVKLDDTHPYAFGMGKEWFIMKRTAGYAFLESGSNIGYILEKEPVSGFAGFKYKDKIKNTLVIGSEKTGSGEVVDVTDDPYFRAFWKSGRVLLGNMVLR